MEYLQKIIWIVFFYTIFISHIKLLRRGPIIIKHVILSESRINMELTLFLLYYTIIQTLKIACQFHHKYFLLINLLMEK